MRILIALLFNNMWGQNTTQSNHSFVVNDAVILEMIPVMQKNYSALFITTNVVFDLIACVLATVFTFRFYKHIEISHPLYAVIFMDIVISTAASYLASILFMFNSIVNIDVISYFEYGFTNISLINNFSSFMMIGFIRYYLIVYTRTNNDEEEIDMIKVKNVCLIMNCIVFIFILLIRGGLYIARFIGYDIKLGMIASGLCLTIVPLVTTLILNKRIDNYLKNEHDVNNLIVNDPSKQPEEDKKPCSNKQSLGDRRGGDGKRRKLNHIMLAIESSSNRVKEESETNIAISRNAWDCKTEAGSSTLHCNDKESHKYGGIYTGETSLNSPNPTNMNEKKFNCLTEDVNMLPNQVNIETQDEIHIIESNVLSEDKSVSLHPHCKVEHRINSNMFNPNIPNNTMNLDENKIEVLETIDEAASNSPSTNTIFPSDPEDNTAIKTKVYSESREHKSIIKFVTITSLLMSLSILVIAFIRTFMDFNFSTVTNVIIFMVLTLFLKLCRTFLVIFSSIYCFELIRSLFLTMTNETVEFFQTLRNRFIAYF